MKRIGVFLAIGVLVGGCRQGEQPKLVSNRVQWIDKLGRTWYAPAVTPAADDPIRLEHPDAGVVAIDRSTGKRAVIKDPSGYLESQSTSPGRRFVFVTETDAP